jgi:hypothetical protein
MSVATAIAPQTLLDLDGDTWDALRRADAERWSTVDELLAALVELTHAHLVAFLRVHSRKGARMPAPLEVPRPERAVAESTPRRLAITELAELAGRDLAPARSAE